MIVQRLVQFTNDSQYQNAKEGTKVQKDSFERFLSSLIRENAKHQGDCYSLNVSDLDRYDLIDFLSFVTGPNDFAFYCENETRLQEAIKDYSDDMQAEIDSVIDDIFHEDMEEMGMMLCHHRDNNEVYWVRR